MVGTAITGRPVVSATALAVPVADPPPMLSSASAPVSAACCRAASATSAGHVLADSGAHPGHPAAERRGQVAGQRRRARGGDQQQAGRAEPADLISQPGPGRARAEHHPAGQRVIGEGLH